MDTIEYSKVQVTIALDNKTTLLINTWCEQVLHSAEQNGEETVFDDQNSCLRRQESGKM